MSTLSIGIPVLPLFSRRNSSCCAIPSLVYSAFRRFLLLNLVISFVITKEDCSFFAAGQDWRRTVLDHREWPDLHTLFSITALSLAVLSLRQVNKESCGFQSIDGS
jgi:hypothetical protein